MIIRPDKLKDDIEVPLENTYDAVELDLELVDLKFLAPLEFRGTALKEKSTVKVDGKLSSRVKRICGRTLKEVEENLLVEFLHYYEIGELDQIDITEDIRETVFLEQPMVYYAPETEGALEKSEELKSNQENDTDNPFAKLKNYKNLKKE